MAKVVFLKNPLPTLRGGGKVGSDSFCISCMRSLQVMRLTVVLVLTILSPQIRAESEQAVTWDQDLLMPVIWNQEEGKKHFLL